MARLILLDRDGVINFDSPDYIKTPDEWRPIPGSLEAVAQLRARGDTVAVCTNQAGIGRGRMTPDDLEAIHGKMHAALEALGTRLDAVAYCPHHPDADCQCRKPRPGMLLAMMERFERKAEDTVFIGDSLKDLQAAAAAGCQGVLVRTGNGARMEPRARAEHGAVRVFDDLASYVRDAIP